MNIAMVPSKKTESGSVEKMVQKPDKLNRLQQHLQDLQKEKFTGYIKINYSQGSIGRIEQFQEILKK
jgi:hypothetical protein